MRLAGALVLFALPIACETGLLDDHLHDLGVEADAPSPEGGAAPEARAPVVDAGPKTELALPIAPDGGAPGCKPRLEPSFADHDGQKNPVKMTTDCCDCKLTGPTQGTTVRRRPWVPTDQHGTLVLEKLRIHDFINTKAIHISLVSAPHSAGYDNPTKLTYAKVLIRSVEIFDIRRIHPDPTCGHFDNILIDGGGGGQEIESEITLEDIHIYDPKNKPGTQTYTLIKGARVSTLTLRRIKHDGVSFQLGFSPEKGEYVKTLVIEESPGLHLSLVGWDSKAKKNVNDIRTIILKDSPGVTGLINLVPGAKIITQTTGKCGS